MGIKPFLSPADSQGGLFLRKILELPVPKKPLSINQIPKEFRDKVKLNVGTFSQGQHHQRQLCSEVECLCGQKKILRNLRVLQNIDRWKRPYVCKGCAMRERMPINQTLLDKIENEYMESELSWREVMVNNNVLDRQSSILERLNAPYLTSMRRIILKKTSLEKQKNEVIERERLLIQKQRDRLEQMEKRLNG